MFIFHPSKKEKKRWTGYNKFVRRGLTLSGLGGGGGIKDTTYLRNIAANLIAFKTWVDTEIVG